MRTQRGPRRGPVRRKILRTMHRIAEALTPLAARANPYLPAVAARLPQLPLRWLVWLRSPSAPWPAAVASAPPELRTVPGIGRDPEQEDRFHQERPLWAFAHMHAEAMALLAPHMWPSYVPFMPNLVHTARKIFALGKIRPPAQPAPLTTAELRQQAAQLGISTIGVAPYDPNYTFAEYVGRNVGDRVIVCVQEQNYTATQKIPSVTAEQAAITAYNQLQVRMGTLAQWLQRQGYRARPEDFDGESMFIHYAVHAGLGQLGMNGQLLTPQAGSRCRLAVMTTDAPLEFDHPVDYGIEGVCDRCQICVRRCPVGAIPNHRREYRGITKSKLNTKRCLPLALQVSGCGVCMKVCPIQKYGLDAVLDEYQRSGRILGKDTDDLEGYDWPLDGKHYGPGSAPRVPDEVERPPGYLLDLDRIEPVATDNPGLLPGLTDD